MSCVVSSKKKLFITIQAVILFLVFSSPMTYKVMRKVLGPMIATFEGLPHPTGILLHALLFGIVTYLLMGAGSSYSKKAVGGSSMNNIMGLNLGAEPVQEGTSSIQGSNIAPKSIH